MGLTLIWSPSFVEDISRFTTIGSKQGYVLCKIFLHQPIFFLCVFGVDDHNTVKTLR